MKFLAAVASGDVEQIKPFAPNDEARQQMEGPDAAEMVEMLQMVMPTKVDIVGGTIDGDEAVLEVTAEMDGEAVTGEITVIKTGDLWLARKMSWNG